MDKKESNKQLPQSSNTVEQSVGKEQNFFCSQQILDEQRIFFRIIEQADILRYFHYWRHRLNEHRQICKRLSRQQRKNLKIKMEVCRLYSDRYLDIYLQVWYANVITGIQMAGTKQPLALDEKWMEEVFAKIYKTQKEPVEKIIIKPANQMNKIKKVIIQKPKSLRARVLQTFLSLLLKKKQNLQQPEQQKLMKQR